jgi:hypothetical protein
MAQGWHGLPTPPATHDPWARRARPAAPLQRSWGVAAPLLLGAIPPRHDIHHGTANGRGSSVHPRLPFGEQSPTPAFIDITGRRSSRAAATLAGRASARSAHAAFSPGEKSSHRDFCADGLEERSCPVPIVPFPFPLRPEPPVKHPLRPSPSLSPSPPPSPPPPRHLAPLPCPGSPRTRALLADAAPLRSHAPVATLTSPSSPSKKSTRSTPLGMRVTRLQTRLPRPSL